MFSPTDPTRAYVPFVVFLSILNPLSLVELSVQVKLAEELDIIAAVNLVGAIGGVIVSFLQLKIKKAKKAIKVIVYLFILSLMKVSSNVILKYCIISIY
jgi:hypothetical protein